MSTNPFKKFRGANSIIDDPEHDEILDASTASESSDAAPDRCVVCHKPCDWKLVPVADRRRTFNEKGELVPLTDEQLKNWNTCGTCGARICDGCRTKETKKLWHYCGVCRKHSCDGCAKAVDSAIISVSSGGERLHHAHVKCSVACDLCESHMRPEDVLECEHCGVVACVWGVRMNSKIEPLCLGVDNCTECGKRTCGECLATICKDTEYQCRLCGSCEDSGGEMDCEWHRYRDLE